MSFDTLKTSTLLPPKEAVADLSETYGEILPESVEKLLLQLQLKPNDIFLDLGSGLGKMVAQVFMTTEVKESCGIEFVSTLHEQANESAIQLLHKYPASFSGNRKLTFLHGDFMKIKCPGATVVFIASAMMTMATLDALGMMMNEMDEVHTVLTLKPLRTLQRLPFKGTIRIECSWDTALCYRYGK